MSGFLTVDEIAALEKLLDDARHEARVDERAGRTEWAELRWLAISDVQGIIERHRSQVRAERALPTGGNPIVDRFYVAGDA